MRNMKKAVQLFGVMAIAVGCLGVATGVEAGEFRGGHNSGHHNGGGHYRGHHHNGFRNGHHFGGFRPGYGYWYGGYRPRWGVGFYPGGFKYGGVVYNRPGDGRPPIFIPR